MQHALGCHAEHGWVAFNVYSAHQLKQELHAVPRSLPLHSFVAPMSEIGRARGTRTTG